jgi:hypothetical protein
LDQFYYVSVFFFRRFKVRFGRNACEEYMALFNARFFFGLFSALKIEAIYFSETSVDFQRDYTVLYTRLRTVRN